MLAAQSVCTAYLLHIPYSLKWSCQESGFTNTFGCVVPSIRTSYIINNKQSEIDKHHLIIVQMRGFLQAIVLNGATSVILSECKRILRGQ